MKLSKVFDYSYNSCAKSIKEGKADYNYFLSIFEQRSFGHPKQAGSYWNLSPEQLVTRARKADWQPANIKVGEGKRAYVTKDLPNGRLGMERIDSLPKGSKLVAIDPKNTGYCSLAYHTNKTDLFVQEAYAITSVNPDGEFLLTIFPGPDIPPQEVLTQSLRPGQKVTPIEAYNLGLNWVKLVR